MKIAYNAILCYLGWQSRGEKFKFSIKNFFIAHRLCSARVAEQERQRKKILQCGSEIAGLFGNFIPNKYSQEFHNEFYSLVEKGLVEESHFTFYQNLFTIYRERGNSFQII